MKHWARWPTPAIYTAKSWLSAAAVNARIDPYIKQKFADLSFASGLNTTAVLELYLSLASEVPQNAAEYYQKISRIYSAGVT